MKGDKDEKEFYTKPSLIKKLYRLAYIFHDIMVSQKIVYYASGGTLLGSIRHKGIIPWDNDLDFCISLIDKERFLSKTVDKLFKKYGYSIKKSINGWYRIEGKNKESADIFFIQLSKEKNEWVVKHTGKALELWPRDQIKLKDLYPLKQTEFGSGFILTPNRPKKSLTSLYGKSWSKVGYITMDQEEHLELDKPIKLKVSVFKAAKPFYNKKQIKLEKGNPYLDGVIL